MKDLTEKWKKGELPRGWYYVLLFSNEEYIAFIDGKWVVDDRLVESDITQVLALVPTYQEYLESEAHCAVYSEKNKQLRALLKECRGGLTEISKDYGYCVAKDINKIIAKIDEAIAIVSGMNDGCENILEGLKNVK